ncbi:hypothetical protein AB0O47_32675 [Streptomyces noursei]|uniref:hypothetical protein n=1 Tax=Streptomyces noursei TaxID=1971 RepID=UPI00344B2077
MIDAYAELQEHLGNAKERFVTEVEGATMKVLADSGLYRHLKFHLPKASWGWCEVVTWPDMLVLRGGLGCWAFTGVQDMTTFFREPEDIARINPMSTESKLVPDGRESAAKMYDPGRAADYIRQTVAHHADEHPDLAADVESELFSTFSSADLDTEKGLREALGRFEASHSADYENVCFPVETWDLYRYNPWFLLSCHVLPWAVSQYDTALTPAS